MVDAHDHRGEATCLDDHSKAPQQLRQLSDDGGDAPGLVAREEVRRRGRRPDPPRAVGLPRSNSGSLAMLATTRRASSRLSSLVAVQGTAAAELFSQKAKPPLTIREHL